LPSAVALTLAASRYAKRDRVQRHGRRHAAVRPRSELDTGIGADESPPHLIGCRLARTPPRLEPDARRPVGPRQVVAEPQQYVGNFGREITRRGFAEVVNERARCGWLRLGDASATRRDQTPREDRSEHGSEMGEETIGHPRWKVADRSRSN
jgi:hypothetical protein